MTVVLPPPTVDDQAATSPTPTPQKKKFGTVFGFRSTSRPRYSEDDQRARATSPPPPSKAERQSLTLGRSNFFARSSIDTQPSSYHATTRRRPNTAGRFSVTNVTFFERGNNTAATHSVTAHNTNTNHISTPSTVDPNTTTPTATPRQAIIDLTLDSHVTVSNTNMKALDTNIPSSSRRGPVRMDTQDGPWSVSVAETPYDARSYSLYIKSESFTITFFALDSPISARATARLDLCWV